MARLIIFLLLLAALGLAVAAVVTAVRSLTAPVVPRRAAPSRAKTEDPMPNAIRNTAFVLLLLLLLGLSSGWMGTG